MHLGTSLCLAVLMVLWVFLVWYPHPLARAIGATSIFLMMLGIDVTVGPLLGWVVYRENKPSLKFDLMVIFLLQAGALGYGLYSLGQGRPVWLVYNADLFELVRANDLYAGALQQARPEFRTPSWTGPRYVGTLPALDPIQRSNDTLSDVMNGVSLAIRPERYVPLTAVAHSMRMKAQPLTILSHYNPPEQVRAILHRYPQADAFFPLKAPNQDMTVLIDKKAAQVIQVVDLRPWA